MAKDLNVAEYIHERERLLSELANLHRRCTHKFPDGTDASETVPVSAERFCRTCGTQYD